MSYTIHSIANLELIVNKGMLDLQCMKALEEKYPNISSNLSGDVDNKYIDHCENQNIDAILFSINYKDFNIDYNSTGYNISSGGYLLVYNDENIIIDGNNKTARVYTTSFNIIGTHSTGLEINLDGAFKSKFGLPLWNFIAVKNLESIAVKYLINYYNKLITGKYYKKVTFEEESFPPEIYKRINKLIMFS